VLTRCRWGHAEAAVRAQAEGAFGAEFAQILRERQETGVCHTLAPPAAHVQPIWTPHEGATQVRVPSGPISAPGASVCPAQRDRLRPPSSSLRFCLCRQAQAAVAGALEGGPDAPADAPVRRAACLACPGPGLAFCPRGGRQTLCGLPLPEPPAVARVVRTGSRSSAVHGRLRPRSYGQDPEALRYVLGAHCL
jgi:hypothetical protein